MERGSPPEAELSAKKGVGVLQASLNHLGSICRKLGRFAEAEPLYKRALVIAEKGLGPEHPRVATRLENCAALLRKTNRVAETVEMEARAKRIRAKQ